MLYSQSDIMARTGTHEMRFIGADGSMGFRRGVTYFVIFRDNTARVYDSRAGYFLARIPYGSEIAFLRNWSYTK